MFDLDQFIVDCRAGLAADRSHKFVREVVARAVSDPAAVLKGLGEPKRAGIHKLYQSDGPDDPQRRLGADDDARAAQPSDVGGDRHLHRPRGQHLLAPHPRRQSGRVEAAGAKALCERDAEPLGHDIIHSVTNPIPRFTGAIHVYGGDFFKPGRRSEWDPETLLEEPLGRRAGRAPVRRGQCYLPASSLAVVPAERRESRDP